MSLDDIRPRLAQKTVASPNLPAKGSHSESQNPIQGEPYWIPLAKSHRAFFFCRHNSDYLYAFKLAFMGGRNYAASPNTAWAWTEEYYQRKEQTIRIHTAVAYTTRVIFEAMPCGMRKDWIGNNT
jgi:hypothetical protein